MLQRNDNPDSDDEIADNNTQTEMVEKKKRPPKTEKQLQALALGRQKMIENKAQRDLLKKENTEVLETVKTKLKKKDQRETLIQEVKENKPIIKKEPKVVVEEEPPEVIIVRKPRKRIIVEESEEEEEEIKPKKIVKRKAIPKKQVEEEEEEEEIRPAIKAKAPLPQQQQQRPALKINFF